MDTNQLKLKILDLAIKGKLCPQNPKDEPASELIKRIREEKAKLVKEKKIKASKTDSYIYRKDDGSFYERIGKIETCIDEEIPFEIPDSWEWVRLNAISIINPRNSAENIMDAGFLSMSAIMAGFKNMVSPEIRKWGDINQGFTHFIEGDLIIAKITPCFQNRKSAIVTGLKNFIGAGTTELHVVRKIRKEIANGFLLGLAKSSYFIESGMQLFTGTAGQQRIDKSFIENFLVSFPPSGEQKRIAEIIEKLFSHLDTIESNQQKLQQNMAAARTKLLDLAIQGKLVPQNSEDEPASKLLEKIRTEKQALIKAGKLKPSKLDSSIYQKEDGSYYERIGKTEKCIDSEIPFPIPPNWAWVRLGNLMSKICSGSTPKGGNNNYKSEGVKFIRSQNVYNDGLRLANVAYIDESMHNSKPNSKVLAEDLLLNITGASIGRCSLVPDNFDTANINQHVLIMRLIDKNIKLFTHAIISSHFVFNQIRGLQKGGTKEGLSAENAAKLLLPLAPVEEQKQIVEKVQSFSRVLDSVR